MLILYTEDIYCKEIFKGFFTSIIVAIAKIIVIMTILCKFVLFEFLKDGTIFSPWVNVSTEKEFHIAIPMDYLEFSLLHTEAENIKKTNFCKYYWTFDLTLVWGRKLFNRW